ncbi:hypothetical protein DASC09_018610 [Saccharomycopsis crataegensis]|uniref:Purine nucleoside permease n=1 Tax=Saccharomycopsis crataegensis TaxID=43959 RepID=A0AAV5QIM5_9ASCO|nr:hypothetical protein DASC09_018610 [Saccharomycopsis crataegensis]
MKFAYFLLAAIASANPVENVLQLNRRDSFNFTNATTESLTTISLTTTVSKLTTIYPTAGSVSKASSESSASAAGSSSVSAADVTSAAISAVSPAPPISISASSSASECSSTDSPINEYGLYKNPNAIKPKAFIISMFHYETIWYEKLDFAHNITVPGLSPLFPHVHCVTNYSICQFITGESEINAAASVTALMLSPLFDLSETYFLIAGIAGGDPSQVTLGSATFAEYVVQVGLEYEVDSREIPEKYNWTTGYFPYDSYEPDAYPGSWYGTEVFRVNGKLRDRAFELASNVTLSVGTAKNVAFRELYDYAPANQAPAVVKCDGVTSDTYWFGDILTSYFSNLTHTMTNGSATFCATAQEDNASMEAIMRAHLFGLADFSRVVVMRTISDFARAPPKYDDDAINFFNNVSQGGSYVSIENIYRAGLPFIEDVLENWDTLYSVGAFKTDEYLGDVFGTLGGTPNFGPGAITEPEA